jgi:hypothetical protein
MAQADHRCVMRADPLGAASLASSPIALALPSATPALSPNLPQLPLNARCDISRGPLLPAAGSGGGLFYKKSIRHESNVLFFGPQGVVNPRQEIYSDLRTPNDSR